MPNAAPPRAPREIVLASAGSGKTFHLSSRIISLLAHGAPPESILASTFTRKAAGQILQRVLDRMAGASLSPEAAAELAKHVRLGEEGRLPLGEPVFWQERLESLVRALHRTGVGTLDSFFVGLARLFARELALPSGWGVADDPTAGRMRSDALQEVLAAADAGEMAQVIRLVNRDRVRRSVHDHLLGRLDELLDIHARLDPAAVDPWRVFAPDGKPLPTAAEIETLARAFEAIPVPTTKSGTPNKIWATAVPNITGHIRAGEWEGFVDLGLCKKVSSGDLTYSGHAITDEVCALVEEGREMAARALRPVLARQVMALGRLTRDFERAYRVRQEREGAYRFDDITRLLSGGDGQPVGARADLYYRLDARLRHLLLDEFQDTSLAQWSALAPLAEEVLADPGDRAAVVVADPKQSIYGWRGGEPEIVHAVADHYRLEARALSTSWRSSPVVLELVNRVFTGVSGLPMLRDDEAWTEAAKRWRRDFAEHAAAPPNRGLPGHVCIEVGPRENGRSGKAEPALCQVAARRVAEIRRQAPGAAIGVLTRTNPTVARMIVYLRDLGIPVSEEGGTPLTDSAGCEAVLALLRLADHPGDRTARYHVARSPLGEALRYADPDDDRASARLAHHARRRLIDRGYGRALEGWVERIAEQCDARELRRLTQLVEAGHRYDDRATLRPADFVRLVESERVEDPSAAPVRVMTVHQAKGLEFDAVVLPELDGPIAKVDSAPALPYRPEPTAAVTAVYPAPSEAVRGLFPEIEAAHGQVRRATLRDGLSTLYVALTRARQAVHVFLRSDGKGISGGKSPAKLLREALADDPESLDRLTEGDVLYEAGDADWAEKSAKVRKCESAKVGASGTIREIVLAQPRERRRLLPERSPSKLEGGASVRVPELLRLHPGAPLDRGSVIHAWFEQIEWLEDGVADDPELRRIARRTISEVSDARLEAWIGDFRRSIESPEVRAALSRASAPPAATVAREVAFVHRAGDVLMEGVIDRLMLIRQGGTVVRAEVIDFKTDAVRGDAALLRQRVEHYRPQLEAYRHAVAKMYRLPSDRVAAALLFTEAAAVR